MELEHVTDQDRVGDTPAADLRQILREYSFTQEQREVFEMVVQFRPLFKDLQIREAFALVFLYGLEKERSLRYVSDKMLGRSISYEMVSRLAKRARWRVAHSVRNSFVAEKVFKEKVRTTSPALYLKVSRDLNNGLDLTPLTRRNKGGHKGVDNSDGEA